MILEARTVECDLGDSGCLSTLGDQSTHFASGLDVADPVRPPAPRQPDQIWVTDITYIRTYEGWLYLAVVIDLYSRMVVGWSMKSTMTTELVLDALMMACWRRHPKNPVIIHSDQGSQFGSDDFNRWCKDNDLRPSMSRRGNCWDTQSKMTSNVLLNLTRAGIGELAFALTCRFEQGVPRAALPGPASVT